MVLDVVLGIIIVAGGLLGWSRGAVRQIIHLCALAAVIVWAPAVGRSLSGVIDSMDLGLPEPIAELLSILGASILLFLIVWLVGNLLTHVLRPDPPVPVLSRLNRMAGCLLGVAKSALVCLLGTAVLAAVPVSTTGTWPAWAQNSTRGSACLYWARQCAPLSWTPAVAELEGLLEQLRQATALAPDGQRDAPASGLRSGITNGSAEPHAQPVRSRNLHPQPQGQARSRHDDVRNAPSRVLPDQ